MKLGFALHINERKIRYCIIWGYLRKINRKTIRNRKDGKSGSGSAAELENRLISENRLLIEGLKDFHAATFQCAC